MKNPDEDTISAVVAEIVDLNKSLQEKFAAYGLSEPSLGVNSAINSPVPTNDAAHSLLQYQYSLYGAAQKLMHLALGPGEALWHVTARHNDSVALAGISQYQLADAVPLDGPPVTYAQVASNAPISEQKVRSLLKHAIANGVFYEPTPGRIAHNALSKLLVSTLPESQLPVSQLNTLYCFPAAAKTINAWQQHPAGDEPTESGFSLSVGRPVSLFQYLGEDQSRVGFFGRAMVSQSLLGGYDIRYLLQGYDWGSIPSRATVVDIGGSMGETAVAIGKVNPGLNFVVQDLLSVVEQGPASIPKDMEQKIEFQGHDFFTPQPIKGAEIYFFRSIFHDWPDKHAVRILKALIPAMDPAKSKIVLCEAVLPQPDDVPIAQFWKASAVNLQMLSMFNSFERTIDDWLAIFAEADSRLKITSVNSPLGSHTSIIEVQLSG